MEAPAIKTEDAPMEDVKDDSYQVHEASQVPVSLPKKRKLASLREPSSSRAASPLPASGPQNEILPSDSANGIMSRLSLNHIARAPVLIASSEPGYFSTSDVPSARNYRYIPARISPTYDPNTTEELPYYRTSESPPTGCVRVSWEDRSPFIHVTEDGLGLAGNKGFRSARLNVPIREGQWYFEINIIHGDGTSDLPTSSSSGSSSAHVRLGWARRESSLNGPVGLDGYSYGIRDKTGEKVTLSRPRPYGRPFATGDVVGLYISLPPCRKANSDDPYDPARIVPKRMPIQYKGQSYFEASEYLHSREMMALMDEKSGQTTNTNAIPEKASAPADNEPASTPIVTKKSATVKNTPATAPSRGKKSTAKASKEETPAPEPLRPLSTLPDSSIVFFVNGESQGTAFRDIYSYLQLPESKAARAKGGRSTVLKERENPFDDGTLGYYPMVSLFGNAKVRINAGPNFTHPPPEDFITDESKIEPDGIHSKKWRPLCERYPEYMAELVAIDEEEERVLRAARVALREEERAAVEKDQVKREKAQKILERKKEKERKVQQATPGPTSASPAPDVHSKPATPTAPAEVVPSMQPTPHTPVSAPASASTSNTHPRPNPTPRPTSTHHPTSLPPNALPPNAFPPNAQPPPNALPLASVQGPSRPYPTYPPYGYPSMPSTTRYGTYSAPYGSGYIYPPTPPVRIPGPLPYVTNPPTGPIAKKPSALPAPRQASYERWPTTAYATATAAAYSAISPSSSRLPPPAPNANTAYSYVRERGEQVVEPVPGPVPSNSYSPHPRSSYVNNLSSEEQALMAQVQKADDNNGGGSVDGGGSQNTRGT